MANNLTELGHELAAALKLCLRVISGEELAKSTLERALESGRKALDSYNILLVSSDLPKRIPTPMTLEERVHFMLNDPKMKKAREQEIEAFFNHKPSDNNKIVKVWACKRCGNDCSETAGGAIICANPKQDGCPYGD